jgi:hypothetical protein
LFRLSPLVVAACTGNQVPAAQQSPPELTRPIATGTPPPQPPLPWGPTREQYDRATDVVAAMSVHEQAGQVLVAEYASAEAATAQIRDLHIGGSS